MRRQLNLMLGLPEDASGSEMRRQYQRVMAALFALDDRDTRYEDRLGKARERLADAYQAFRKAETRDHKPIDFESVTSAPPMLGELLVESSAITREQLDLALATQRHSKRRIPLGRLLVSWKIITWDELAFYLRLQDLLKLSPLDKARMSRQLVELGLLTNEEVEQAEMDCETVGCSFQHAVCRRGWVKEPLLDKLHAPEPPVHQMAANA